MFRKDADFEAFERVLVEAHQRQPIRILSVRVNAPLSAKVLDRVRVSIEGGQP